MELWIARDKNGDIFLYEMKPIRKAEHFARCGRCIEVFNPYLFPEVTWENSPKKVEIKLKEE